MNRVYQNDRLRFDRSIVLCPTEVKEFVRDVFINQERKLRVQINLIPYNFNHKLCHQTIKQYYPENSLCCRKFALFDDNLKLLTLVAGIVDHFRMIVELTYGKVFSKDVFINQEQKLEVQGLS